MSVQWLSTDSDSLLTSESGKESSAFAKTRLAFPAGVSHAEEMTLAFGTARSSARSNTCEPNLAQVMPDRPAITCTIGTRVGDGVGLCTHTPSKQSPAEEQSPLSSQFCPKAHGVQSGPPQSTSVSPMSCIPLKHAASEGTLVGNRDGAGDGNGLGIGVG